MSPVQKNVRLLATLLLLPSACAHTAVGITPSTRPIPPSGYSELGTTSGTDCRWALFGLVPVTGSNSLQDAIQEAISERPGANAMIQVTADTYYQNFLLFDRSCTRVDGIAISTL